MSVIPIFSQTKRLQSRVLLTQDLIRVSQLRRRTWTPEEGEELAERMTELLRTPHGQMKLRAVQAIALFELATVGGLFAPIRVGGGKSLISLLAPVVLQRVKKVGYRPLLLVPAALVEKTERDRKALAEHFEVTQFLKIMSYEFLGRVQAAGVVADPEKGIEGKPSVLEEFQPDLVIMDECHKTKNLKAAVSRRVRRHMQSHPSVIVAAMSGTITKRSLHDYAHIIRWCLPASDTPLPLHFSDLEEWALALDERKSSENRADPGELRILCNEEENKAWDDNPRLAARSAFRRRLVDTPGVVASHESPIDASLNIRGVKPDMSPVIDEAFQVLRSRWETPDGWPFADGLEMFRHARELAAGFYYRWNPRPAREWLDPRKAWCKFVRETLKHSRKFDSELQVRNWGATLPEDHEGSLVLNQWLVVRDTFEPNTEPVWLDTSLLQFAADWASKHRGIIWCEHQCFGQRLEKEAGIPYYGKKGRNGWGQFIDDHPANQSLVASIQSNKEGRNLQKWCENLILSMPPNGATVEQTLGRTHRDGQDADEVTVDVVVSCVEHLEAFEQAIMDSRYVEASTGSPQKLLLAAVDMPWESLLGSGPRWEK